MMYTSLINVYIATLIAAVIHALPNGAPNCPVGKAASGNLHLLSSRNPTTGSLSSAGFIVKIDGFALDPSGVNEIKANKELEVVITSDTGLRPFRGVLMIASKLATSTLDIFSLSTSQAIDLKISAPCTNAGRSGVTHVDHHVKTKIAATMQFNENFDNLDFDVNVVVLNQAINLPSESIYYYTQYKLKVTNANPKPTKAPTKGPKKASTKAPTKTPSKAPTKAPTTRCRLLGIETSCP